MNRLKLKWCGFKIILLIGIIMVVQNFSLPESRAEKNSMETYGDLLETNEFQVTYLLKEKNIDDSLSQKEGNVIQEYENENIIAVKDGIIYLYMKYKGSYDTGQHMMKRDKNIGIYTKQKGKWKYAFGYSEDNKMKSMDPLFSFKSQLEEILTENDRKKLQMYYKENFGWSNNETLPHKKTGIEIMDNKQLNYEEYGNQYVTKRYYFNQGKLEAVIQIYKPSEILGSGQKIPGGILILQLKKIDREIDGDILELMELVKKDEI